MKTIDVSDAQGSLAEYVRHKDEFPLLITEGGEPVAALLAVPNADVETISLSTNPQFLAIIERSRQRLAAEGGITAEEMRKRLGMTRGESDTENHPSSP